MATQSTAADRAAIDERDAANLWHRGIDWFVFKRGNRCWVLADCFHHPSVFPTKKAAYDAGTAYVLEISRAPGSSGHCL